MPDYLFKDGFPCFAPNAGFRIRDCMVYRMQGGQEVAEWDYWNYQCAAPADFPVQAVQQFWRDLAAAPHWLIGEDQWSSRYYTLLGNSVVHWTDDRQQSASFIHSCTETSDFLQSPSPPDAAKHFVKAKLA